jgi:hypothetical protein
MPEIWGVRLNAADAPAAHRALMDDAAVALSDLLRDNTDRDQRMAIMPLLLDKGGELLVTPDGSMRLAAGDQLLFAGAIGTRRRLDLTLQNANVLDYVLTGHERASGWLWQKFTRTAV